MKHTPLELYRQRIQDQLISPDPVQEKAVDRLQRVHDDVVAAEEKHAKRWFNKRGSTGSVRGLYMHGGVGRGKSMLMDLFYECLPPKLPARRVHFHEFMIEVHAELNERRKVANTGKNVDTILPGLAKAIAKQAHVLCFDEFHVTDIADAMILSRLFNILFERGVTVIATSNWPPKDLYKDGLQRDRFVPFIQTLEGHCEIFYLDSPHDYRALCLQEEGSYFTPLSSTATQQMAAVFRQLTNYETPHTEEIEVKGRIIPIHKTAQGTAWFTFAELCEQPHGAEDFLEIAQRYHTVFLEGIPTLGYDRRNEAKRLMLLIDALYESRVRLVVTADATPERLYRGHDHAFEFQRTVSRLLEMQSPGYLV